MNAFAAILRKVLRPMIALAVTLGPTAQAEINIPLARFTAARTGQQAPSEFGLWLAYWSPDRAWYNVEVENVPWRLDFFSTGAYVLGRYGNGTPYYPQGPHMIERYPGGADAYYTDYLASITTFFARYPTDFSGIIAIDAEYWAPFWIGHPDWPSTLAFDANDQDPLTDWRDHIRATRAADLAGLTPAAQEEIFRQTWLAATRRFFTSVYTRVKELRPNAKVGFYNIPFQSYWEWQNPTKAAQWRWAYDNEMGWFWDMVDVILPSIYPFYESSPDRPGIIPAPYNDYHSDFERYFRNNINECMRHARGKPVVPYISTQYHGSNPTLGNHPVNEWMMRRSFEIPREMGCSGVVMWAFPQSQAEFDRFVPFYRDTLNPFLRQFALLPSLASTLNPPPLTAPSAPPAQSNPGSGNSAPPPAAPVPAPEVPPALISPTPPTAPTTPRGSAGGPVNIIQPPLADPRDVLGGGGPAAGSADVAAAPTAKSGGGRPQARATAKSTSTLAAPQGVQSVRGAGGDTVFSSEPPIVISSTGQVLADSKDPYASALARVLETATGDTGGSTRTSGSSAIAAALARQQSGVFGTSNPTIVYQSSKPKPTVAPNKDKVITSVPTPP